MSPASGNGASSQSQTVAQERRDALWKWRWLGWRKATPAFKASLVLLAAITFALGAYAAVGMGR